MTGELPQPYWSAEEETPSEHGDETVCLALDRQFLGGETRHLHIEAPTGCNSFPTSRPHTLSYRGSQ